MDASFIIASLSTWVSYLFPSLAEYVKYIGPATMMVATTVGVFTNILPEPGHQYSLPDTRALEAELAGSGGFILKIAKFTRAMVVGTNWFIATPVYAGFYNTTNAVSGVLSKVKLAPKPPVKN